MCVDLPGSIIHTASHKELKSIFPDFHCFSYKDKLFFKKHGISEIALLPLTPRLIASPQLAFASSAQTY